MSQENSELARQCELLEESHGSLVWQLQTEIAGLKERLARTGLGAELEAGLREEIEVLRSEAAQAGERERGAAREIRNLTESLRQPVTRHRPETKLSVTHFY